MAGYRCSTKPPAEATGSSSLGAPSGCRAARAFGNHETGSEESIGNPAPTGETSAVIGRKSAEAIVASKSERRMGEGPNMREQGGAVIHSTPATSPRGGALERRGVTQPSLHDDLMDRMLDRDPEAGSDLDGHERQGLLAPIAVAGNANRNDE